MTREIYTMKYLEKVHSFLKSVSGKLKTLRFLPLIPKTSSNKTFLEDAYREILGRDIDQDGLNSYTKLLKAGYSRTYVLMSIVKSDEFINKVLKENNPIQNLRELRPSSYDLLDDISKTHKILLFNTTSQDDFNWLESMIVENGYYEKPGVWGFTIDLDKKVMAEIVSVFKPNRALEIGCANGAIMQCLRELNIFCEGVEISQMAINKAFPEIKNNIHKRDLLQLELPYTYDLIFGLDIFEHLNPNKLDDYLAKIDQILSDGGYLFCNIPAFGDDPIFGTIFPIYIKDWEQDIHQGKFFAKIHVDKDGYPMHGHLIWADSQWWVKQFKKRGFHRELEIEKALHGKYDDYMEKMSIARKSYYVFSKISEGTQNKDIINRIISTPSNALNSDYY